MTDAFFEKLEKLNWKIFLIGVLIGMAAVFLIKTTAVIRVNHPLEKSVKKINFEIVISRLSKKKNDFRLRPTKENFVQTVNAQEKYIPANAYIAVNFDTGDILAEKDAAKILAIASLTKIMTAVVALDLANPNDIFTISQNAASKPATKIGVVAGEKMALWELLNAALLTSANDAAEAIKDGINNKYQSDIFIQAMNEKAKILGLKNSSFANPQGLDNANNYSSAADIAILSHYALTNYPLISGIVKKNYEFLPKDNNHKQFDLYNWNGLLDVYPNVSGIKIGNTDHAHHTTAVLSERRNKRVLAVLLGAKGVLERDLLAANLLNIGFEKLGLQGIDMDENMLTQKYSTWRYWN